MDPLDVPLEFIGKDVYHRSFDALLERNKRAVGNLIKTEIPSEGTRFEDYIDGMFSFRILLGSPKGSLR